MVHGILFAFTAAPYPIIVEQHKIWYNKPIILSC